MEHWPKRRWKIFTIRFLEEISTIFFPELPRSITKAAIDNLNEKKQEYSDDTKSESEQIRILKMKLEEANEQNRRLQEKMDQQWNRHHYEIMNAISKAQNISSSC